MSFLTESFRNRIKQLAGITPTVDHWEHYLYPDAPEYLGKTTDFKPHAYLALTNSGGIELELNHSNDGVRYRYTDGKSSDTSKEAEIMHDTDAEGTAYFITDTGIRYNLSDFMKTNY